MNRLRSHSIADRFSFSGLRCLLQYSTSTAHFMVDYLIDSLGFSREEAISASTKVTHLKSPKNPDLVLNLLKQIGFDNTQIKNIVFSAPTLLSSDVDKTLKPKIRVLQDLGLSGSDLAKFIKGNRGLFNRGLDTHIIPSLDYLRRALRSDENVIRALKRSQWLLTCNTLKKMPPNVLLLRKCGLSIEKIEKFIINNPRYVLQKPEWLEEIVHRVEEELGIPRVSRMFLYGIDALASSSKSTLERKFGIFRSFGWSNSEISTMARNLPYCLSLSEAKIRNALNYFMKEIGYAPGYLASHPKLLMHSLEKRVVPRNEVLKILIEKKLNKSKQSLYAVVCLTESKFIEDYVLPYKNKMPDLYGAYNNRMRQ
ncbi:unnamed protein product [Ilex paraguariensis]|uniref:Mitochondrial transcription termination factor n=1 Tax=Ilex paraguariensis TaxID=185542 RepID=A0ABC8UV16_9AQUA